MMQQSPRLYATVGVGPHARHFVYFTASEGVQIPLERLGGNFVSP